MVDYAYGRPSYSGSAKTLHEELATNQFDAYGSMVNGKKIDTTELGAGNYRLTVSVTDPATQQKLFSTTSFQIGAESSPSDVWQIDDEGLQEYVTSGQADFDRGVVFLANKDQQAALGAFQQALRHDPNHERARARLADYYFQQKDFAKVVELFAHQEVTSKTEDGTILAVADSLDRTGRSSQAAELLETALKVKTPTGPLYLALATYYQHSASLIEPRPSKTKGGPC